MDYNSPQRPRWHVGRNRSTYCSNARRAALLEDLAYLGVVENVSIFADRRLLGRCAYCGGPPQTRDHVPSKVLLDVPLPPDIPVVGCCKSCNAAFSKDEEYLAAAVECARCGSVDPAGVQRPKVRRILSKHPRLQKRLAIACSSSTLIIEAERVDTVALKLARGHATFELSEPQHHAPTSMGIAILDELAPEKRAAFETPPALTLSPEVGSRGMQRAFRSRAVEWIEVQPGRYRYLAATGSAVTVRMVLSEFVAAEVIWDSASDALV